MFTLPENIICGYCNCTEFGSLTVSPERVATKYEIELYLEDGRSTFSDGVEYKIKKNFIRITRPGQRRYSLLPFRTAYIKFDAQGDLAGMLCEIPEYFYCAQPTRFCGKIDEIVLLSEGGKEQVLLMQSRVLSLLNLVMKDARLSSSAGTADHSVVFEAKKYIEDNAHRRICLHDVAAFVNLSDVYFHNTFKLSTGKTPHEYLTACRLDRAKKLLWENESPIREIAEKCGFSSPQHFTKVFTKLIGTSPARYRRDFQQRYMD